MQYGRCPLCGPTLLIRLSQHDFGVRCLRCRASAVTMSLVDVLRDSCPDLANARCYELSSRGALVRFLERKVTSLQTSEYFDDVRPGETRDGVRCEDVQALTFANASFNVCTSTEVFEHVPDDARGFREIRRVLRPGGHFIFTVPMHPFPTVERARLVDGKVEHLLPAEWHSDRLRGTKGVLCYRNYGEDILDRLRAAGFAEARLRRPTKGPWLGVARPVIVARAD